MECLLGSRYRILMGLISSTITVHAQQQVPCRGAMHVQVVPQQRALMCPRTKAAKVGSTSGFSFVACRTCHHTEHRAEGSGSCKGASLSCLRQGVAEGLVRLLAQKGKMRLQISQPLQIEINNIFATWHESLVAIAAAPPRHYKPCVFRLPQTMCRCSPSCSCRNL